MGSAPASDRDRFQVGFRRSFWVELRESRGLDAARRDAVHRDAARAELAGERLCPAVDTGPHGITEREMLSRFFRGKRGEDENSTASALHEIGQAEVDQAHGREEEQFDGLLERLGADRDCRPRRWTAAVPDEDVDAPERLYRLPHDGLEIARVRDVAAHGESADSVGLALEHVASPREHGHVCAFGTQRLGRRQAEPGRCAADDRGPAFETEIHGYESSRPTTSRTAPADSFSTDELAEWYAADSRRAHDRDHLVAVPAEDHGGDVLDGSLRLPGDEGREACRVKDPCHPEHSLLRPPGDVLGDVAHCVEWVGDDDENRVGALRDRLLGHVLDDLLVRGDEVVAAHAGRAR